MEIENPIWPAIFKPRAQSLPRCWARPPIKPTAKKRHTKQQPLLRKNSNKTAQLDQHQSPSGISPMTIKTTPFPRRCRAGSKQFGHLQSSTRPAHRSECSIQLAAQSVSPRQQSQSMRYPSPCRGHAKGQHNWCDHHCRSQKQLTNPRLLLGQ